MNRPKATLMLLVVSVFLSACGGSGGLATATPGSAVSPSPTGKTESTPTPVPTSTVDPRFMQVLWNQLPDGVSLIFEDEHSQRMRDVRIIRDQTVLVSAAFRTPMPGEPRTCGHPDVIRPKVAPMAVSGDVMSEFKEGGVSRPTVAGTPLKTLRVEVRQLDGVWNAVPADMLIFRQNQAGGPCFQ